MDAKQPKQMTSWESKSVNNRSVELFLMFVYCLMLIDFSIITPLGSYFIEQKGFTTGQYTLFLSAYSLLAAFSGLLASSWINLFCLRKSLIAHLLLLGGAFLLGAFSDDFQTFTISRCLAGVSAGGLRVLTYSIISRLVPENRRGSACGTLQISNPIKAMIGVPLCLFIARVWDYQWFFFGMGGVALLLVLLCRFFIPKIPPIQNKALKVKNSLFLSIIKNKTCSMGLLLYGLVTFGGGLLVPFLPSYIVMNLKVTEPNLSTIFFFSGLLGFFTFKWIGSLQDKLGFKAVQIKLSVIYGATLLGFAIYSYPPFSIVLLLASLDQVLYPNRNAITLSWLTTLGNPEQRGSYLSVAIFIRELSTALATTVAGFFISTLQFQTGQRHLVGFKELTYFAASLVLLSIFLSLFAGKSAPNKAIGPV